MKTFEERYTAWIDGQLTGDTLVSFEQELARRAEAGDGDAAEADKASALRLRSLLKEHLQAPTLTNSEFFNHQMRDRIDAEIDRAARRRESTAKPAWKFPAFAWPFTRLVGAGAACLFVAGALYYGMMPSHAPNVADNSPVQTKGDAVVKIDSPAPQPQVPAVDRPENNKFASLTSPTPKPVDLTTSEDIQVVQPDAAGTTRATPLHYDKANVLWVTGLPYLPNVSGLNPTPAPSAAPSVAP